MWMENLFFRHHSQPKTDTTWDGYTINSVQQEDLCGYYVWADRKRTRKDYLTKSTNTSLNFWSDHIHTDVDASKYNVALDNLLRQCPSPIIYIICRQRKIGKLYYAKSGKRNILSKCTTHLDFSHLLSSATYVEKNGNSIGNAKNAYVAN